MSVSSKSNIRLSLLLCTKETERDHTILVVVTRLGPKYRSGACLRLKIRHTPFLRAFSRCLLFSTSFSTFFLFFHRLFFHANSSSHASRRKIGRGGEEGEGEKEREKHVDQRRSMIHDERVFWSDDQQQQFREPAIASRVKRARGRFQTPDSHDIREIEDSVVFHKTACDCDDK